MNTLAVAQIGVVAQRQTRVEAKRPAAAAKANAARLGASAPVKASVAALNGARPVSMSAQRRMAVSVSADAATTPTYKVCRADHVKSLLNDKGYVVLDIRTSKEYRTGNGLHWLWLPLAEEDDAGNPIMNPNFKALFDKKFKNKMSRVIIACQDGGRRSEIAAQIACSLGYSAIYIIEGGVTALLQAMPLEERDTRPRVARVEQHVGIKYGGTGVTSEATPDDSA